jgi:iron complex outermembrane receptor protein
MRNSITIILVAILSGVCIPVLAESEWSDESESPDQGQAAVGGELQEITVTARRREEPLQKVPLAVSVIGGDSLARQGIQDIRDMSGTVPNLTVQAAPSTAQGGMFVAIRGQAQTDLLLSIDSPVGLYLDGVNVPHPYGGGAALVDLQRVEVLRGPQGTLYGKNTTGGAVSFITKDPDKEWGGSIQATAGNFSQAGFLGILNAPIADNVGARFVAQVFTRGPLGHDSTGQGLMDQDNAYLRGKVKGEFGNLTVTFTAAYNHFHGGPSIFHPTGFTPATATLPPGGVATVESTLESGLAPTPANLAATYQRLQGYVGGPPRFWNSFDAGHAGAGYEEVNGALNMEYKVSDALTLRSITGYQWFRNVSDTQLDGLPFDILSADLTTHDHFFSEEFQALGGGETFNWVTGLYVGRERGLEFSTSLPAPILLADTVTINDSDVINNSQAIFGQFNWNFLPKWSLTLGARYTKEIKDLITRNRTNLGCSIPKSLLNTPGVCLADIDGNYDDPSGIFSVSYAVSSDINAYVKYARGFTGGGQNLRGSGTVQSFAPFGPVTVNEYEVGIKSQWLDRHLLVNLAAYWDDYRNLQRTTLIATPSGAAATLITNAATATSKGIELETVLNLVPGLDLHASGGFNYARYGRFVDTTGDRSHEDWPTPETTADAGGRYVRTTPLGDLSMQVDYVWRSDQKLYSSGALRSQLIQPAYGLVNARVGMNFSAWGGFEVALLGTNLTNEKYYVGGLSVEALGFNDLMAGDPRMYRIELTKRFGSEK